MSRLSTSSGRPRTSASRLGTAAARPAPPKIKKKRVEEIERKPEMVNFSSNEMKLTIIFLLINSAIESHANQLFL